MTGLAMHPPASTDIPQGPISMRGAGTLACLQTAMGMDEVADGTVLAFLLLTHPPARRPGETAAGIEAELRELGARVGLAPETTDDVPLVGPRVALVHGLALLDTGGLFLRLGQPRADWAEHVADGGPVLVMLGLDPLPAPSRWAVDTYITQAALTRRAMVGLAHGRRVTPAALSHSAN